jgi:ADP-heptose:LPS heptosyltransferase
MGEKKNMKGVIAVLTLNHIGDVLFTEPAITALRAGYPTDRLVVITSGEGQAVLANHPAIDALWVRERTLTGWWRLVKRLRKIAPPLVVSFSPSSFGLALAAFLSGASKRFGFSVRPVQWRFFTTALPFRSERHVADDYLALAEAAGGKRERRLPRLFLTDDEREQAYQTLRALGWDGTTPLLGCHPFSSVAHKEWGDENFAALLAWASNRWSFRPIIFGSPAERDRAERLAVQVQGISAAGKLSLRAFIAAASWCAAFVGGDSGPVHIAAALGVPTLALYGPTDPQRTGPLGERVAVVQSPTGTMRDLAVAAAQSAAERLWAKVASRQ